MPLEAHTLLGIELVNSTKGNKSYPDIIDNTEVQITFCLIYLMIFVLGIFGNVLVCYVVIRNKAMQTVTNLFITNLALSDILLCVLALPFTPLYTFLGKWIFGQLSCHLMPYAQGCSVYISTLTLTSIAIDRYFVIIYPFRPRMKLLTCILIIIFIWTFSLIATCPYGLFMAIVIENNKTFCEEHWPSEHSRKIFGTATTIMQFLLPFAIITFCYTFVSCKLSERAKTKPGSQSSRRDELDRERKKKTNRMLIAMVTIFGISWLPLNLINLSSDYNDKVEAWNLYYFLFFLAHSFAMASTCYNPFLYAWLNENFRKEFKQVLPCFDVTPSIRGSINSGRLQPLKSEKTCNGNNDTQHESLLKSTPSIKKKVSRNIRRNDNAELECIALDIKNISSYVKDDEERTETQYHYNVTMDGDNKIGNVKL